jgi:AraC family transcriptional regulator, ethanolamine operon transcriptional activator
MSTISDGDAVRDLRFTDPDEAAAAYHGVDMDLSILSRASTDWRVLQVDAGDSVFCAVEIAAAVSAASAMKSDTMAFCIGVGGSGGWTVNGHSVDSRSLAFFSEGTETVARTTAPLDWLAVNVSRASFARSFENFTHRSFAVANGISIFAPKEAQYLRLRNDFITAAGLAKSAPHLLRDGEIRASLEKTLLEAVFNSLGYPAVSEHLNYRSLATRARDYLKAHGSRAVFQADLCAELDISDRSLRRVFVDYFGMSPGRYLKLLRLNQARRALRAVEQPVASVTEVGMRYAFFDLGRFAADYRSLFGELPSSTLRKARAGIT